MKQQEVVIRCEKLSKDYGSNNGLFDCNLTVKSGEVFGLIGPNGAGKSTLLKLLMDSIKPSSGSAEIFELDTQQHSLELKARIGYLPGELMDFPSVTAGYILNLLLNLRGIEDRERLKIISNRLQLDLNRKYQELSHGNKQKVGLVQAFMHNPELLILDEPTIGLDPVIQRELRTMVQEAVQEGKTVLLSSHVLSDVESVCSRIGLIIGGRIVREGTLAELRSERIHKITASFIGKKPTSTQLITSGATEVVVTKDSVYFESNGSINEILQLLSHFQVSELDSRELSLEEVFFSEVNR
ncbi:MAG: ABC transporter ATP-binding protein [Actinobacteria bacterium]|nr:ABC transporter ATP-binding protein [Actinomycetota bacterium]